MANFKPGEENYIDDDSLTTLLVACFWHQMALDFTTCQEKCC